MKSRDVQLLEALAADCAGRQKAVAAEAFPTMRVEVAEGEATNILAGRRRPTAAFLREAMADTDRNVALTLLAEWAGYELTPVRRDVGDLLADALARQGELIEASAQQSERLDRLIEMYRETREPKRARANGDAREKRA